MVVKFNHQLFIERILSSDKIKFFILGFALVFRAYFIFFRGISIDEASFWGYVRTPGWSSIFWANYPPLFIFLFKCLYGFGFESFQFARGIIFCISAIGFVLLFDTFKGKKDSVPALVFWSICPASLVALGFAPAVFIEFFSILGWIAFKKNKKALVIISLLGMLLTSYTAFIYVIFLFVLFQLKESSLFKLKFFKYLFLIFCLVAVGATIFIRWNYLSWLKSGSLRESFFASFEFLRNLVGYSWIGLIAYVSLLAYSKNRKVIFTCLLMAILIFAVNIIGGLVAKEPRFILFFVPWLIASFYEISKKSRLISFIFLGALFYHVLWFAITKKSGLEDAIQQVQIDQVRELHTDLRQSLLAFIPVEKKTITAKCCNTCAFLGATFQVDAEKRITDEVSKQHLEVISKVNLGPQTLQPFFYILVKGDKCL